MAFAEVAYVGPLAIAGFAAVAGTARIGVWLLQKRSESRMTTDQRRQFVFDRMVDAYSREGHPNPIKAAGDHKMMLVEIERFSRHARDIYARTGEPLSEIRENWIKVNARNIQNTYASIYGKADAVLYARTLIEAISQKPEDEVFNSGESAAKWTAEKAERFTRLTAPVRDTDEEAILAALWDNRNDSTALIGKLL